MFTSESWKLFSMDVRRMRRDPHARLRVVLRIFFLAPLLVWCGLGLRFGFGDPASAVEILIASAVVGGFLLFVRWRIARDERKELAVELAETPRETVRRLQLMARGLAAAMARSLGELWLQQNTVPEGAQPLVRQKQIEHLKQSGTWDELPAGFRNWMARPDGSWPQQHTEWALSLGETLHTLLWVLALEQTLRPLEEIAQPLNLQTVAQKLEKDAPGVRPTWDLRVERNHAARYFSRCYAEAVYRGYAPGENDEQRRALVTRVDEIRRNGAPDAMSGTLTISEVEKNELLLLLRSASGRSRVLAIVMEILDGKEQWNALEKWVFAPFREEAISE